LSLLACAAGCEPAGARAPTTLDAGARIAPAVRVETQVLAARDFEERIELSGSLEAKQDATLSAQSAGTVTSLLELGDHVAAGALIAQLDAAVLKANLDQAKAMVQASEAALALAKDNHHRQQPLLEKKVISPLEFENIRAQLLRSEADLAQAKANEARARKQLVDTRIVAPFAGRVEHHFIKTGEQVSPGAPVVRITNARVLTVKAGVPERYAADLAPGAEARVSFGAYGLEPRTGRVGFVGGAIDPKNRTFTVEIELENEDGRLKPEMLVKLLLVRAKHENALVLPLSAVLYDDTGATVFAIEKADGMARAVRKPVRLAVDSDKEVVIAGGLQAGDEVVVLGQSQLNPGDAVEVVTRHSGRPEAP
jgi:membrane fusion protein (multidrug efflux system)